MYHLQNALDEERERRGEDARNRETINAHAEELRKGNADLREVIAS